LCNYSRGEEILRKLKKLDGWVKETGAEWVGQSFDSLQHVLQVLPSPQKKAAKVLVMSDKRKRKLCEDPETREKDCPSLNVWQLKQLLSLYTPTEGEEKLPLDLLAKLIAKRTQGMKIIIS